MKNNWVQRGAEVGERTNGNTRADGEVCVGGSQISRSPTSVNVCAGSFSGHTA